jgi:tetratricopeptide (TPR) repeat protein
MGASDSTDRYARSCFVIMPYGTCDVAARRVNFDRVYEQILKPAIRRVTVDGKTMIPVRADEAAQSRILVHAMMRDLLSCRLALAEVSTRNQNVFWELGVRHAAVESGTVLERLRGCPIPFDIAPVLVNEYVDRPPAAAVASVGTIAAALRATLRANETDSPAYTASQQLAALMGPPERPTRLGQAITDAEVTALQGAPQEAAKLYAKAVALAPKLPLLHGRQGRLFLESGDEKRARQAFLRVLDLDPRHHDVRRVLGDLGRGQRPAVVAPNPFEPAVVNDLVAIDGTLDLDLIRRTARAARGMNVRILPGSSRRGDYRSIVRVIDTPATSISSVEDILRRCGAEASSGALAVPEANRTIFTFDVKSPNRAARKSLVGELEDKLSALPSVGKIDIGGGFKGGSGSGGGFGGW